MSRASARGSKPWHVEHTAGRITRPLRHNGQNYSGINILTLWLSAETQGFLSPFWLPYKQAQELGGHVRKTERGSPVVYASTFKKAETTDDGQETETEFPFLKEYTVFCADQCAGLPQHFSATADGEKSVTVSARFRLIQIGVLRSVEEPSERACRPVSGNLGNDVNMALRFRRPP